MDDFELDPERALWKPSRRSFFFGLGAALIASALPDILPAPGLKAAAGWGDGALAIGETITFSGVFAVNPITYSISNTEVFIVTSVTDGPNGSVFGLRPKIMTPMESALSMAVGNG